jgi:hypothetical protein
MGCMAPMGARAAALVVDGLLPLWLRLAGSFACFQPPAEAPEPGDPPCLSGGPQRLLSRHELLKLNEPLPGLWARLAHCGIDPARARMEGQYSTTPLSSMSSPGSTPCGWGCR